MPASSATRTAGGDPVADGGAGFEAMVATAAEDLGGPLTDLLRWARSLEQENLVRLYSYRGKQQTSLLPRLLREQVGLVSIWQNGTVTLWNSVFERRAPAFLKQIEALTGLRMGMGTNAGPITPELLALLTDAYRAAAS